MTKTYTYSSSKMSINKFFEMSLSKIIEAITLHPKHYIEVQIVYCIGKTTNATISIDVEESELEQHVVEKQKDETEV